MMKFHKRFFLCACVSELCRSINLFKRKSSPFIGILRFFSKHDDEAIQAT